MDVPRRTPPIVLDTNVLVAGACRHESSLAHKVLMAVLHESVPLMLTPGIAWEYLDVLQRPRIRRLTGLRHDQSNDLVTELIALSHKVQLHYAWRPNLRDDTDNKFIETAIHGAAIIVTYNKRHFMSGDLRPYGWRAMTPEEFVARYLD